MLGEWHYIVCKIRELCFIGGSERLKIELWRLIAKEVLEFEFVTFLTEI